MDIWQLIAVWLHTVAFVIAWGYYGVLGRMVIPGLEPSLDGPALGNSLAAIERRAIPLVLMSMALFVVTGSYLLFIDPRYEGLGNFFANSWTTFMLAKHVVVIGLIGLGLLVDRYVRRLQAASDEVARASALRGLRLSAEGATGLGAVIVLLTVAAQLST
jgi:uncharacterized membrane protein